MSAGVVAVDAEDFRMRRFRGAGGRMVLVSLMEMLWQCLLCGCGDGLELVGSRLRRTELSKQRRVCIVLLVLERTQLAREALGTGLKKDPKDSTSTSTRSRR